MNDLSENQENFGKWVRYARLLASFSLFGAVLAGMFTGGHEFNSIDPHVLGVVAGAVFGLLVKLFRLI
jgi:hypothetical protein